MEKPSGLPSPPPLPASLSAAAPRLRTPQGCDPPGQLCGAERSLGEEIPPSSQPGRPPIHRHFCPQEHRPSRQHRYRTEGGGGTQGGIVFQHESTPSREPRVPRQGPPGARSSAEPSGQRRAGRPGRGLRGPPGRVGAGRGERGRRRAERGAVAPGDGSGRRTAAVSAVRGPRAGRRVGLVRAAAVAALRAEFGAVWLPSGRGFFFIVLFPGFPPGAPLRAAGLRGRIGPGRAEGRRPQRRAVRAAGPPPAGGPLRSVLSSTGPRPLAFGGEEREPLPPGSASRPAWVERGGPARGAAGTRPRRRAVPGTGAQRGAVGAPPWSCARPREGAAAQRRVRAFPTRRGALRQPASVPAEGC